MIMKKFILSILILFMATTGHTDLPLNLETFDKIQDGKIDYEVKNGHIFVSVTDKYGDAHVHLLSHEGVSQEEALKILSTKKTMLENQKIGAVEQKKELWKREENAEDKEGIMVAPEDQACMGDDECTAMDLSCVSKDCDCGTPVNKKYTSLYQNLREQCLENKSTINCERELYCPPVKCVDGQCLSSKGEEE